MASTNGGFTQIFEGLTQAQNFQNNNQNRTSTNTTCSNKQSQVLYPSMNQSQDKTKSLGNHELFKQRTAKPVNKQSLIQDFYTKTGSNQPQGMNVKSTNNIFDKIGNDTFNDNNKGLHQVAGISKEDRDKLFARKPQVDTKLGSDFAKNLQYRDTKKVDPLAGYVTARIDQQNISSGKNSWDKSNNSSITSFFNKKGGVLNQEEQTALNNNTCIATGNINMNSRIQKNSLIDDDGIWSQMNQESKNRSIATKEKNSIIITEKSTNKEYYLQDKLNAYKNSFIPKHPPCPSSKYNNPPAPGNKFNISEDVPEDALRSQRYYHKQKLEENKKSIEILQKQLAEQHKQELVDKGKEQKKIEEERVKQRKKDEQLRKQRELLMKGEKERLKMLSQMEEIDIGDDFQGPSTITLELQKRFRNYDYLLKRILEAKFQYGMASNPNNIKVPDDFRSTVDYQNVFCQLCASECISNLNQVLVSKVKNEQDVNFIKNCELNYTNHESEEFIVFNLEPGEDNDQYSLRNAEFISRSNYLVVLTNMDRFHEEDVNTITKKHFCLIASVLEVNDQIKVKISAKFEKIFERQKVCKNKTNVFTFERITTQIREFLAIKNLEFDFLKRYVMIPKLIVSESLKKHDDEVFQKFFNSIQNLYNTSQLESIKNICLTKQGIKLLQGPPGTGKTHTLQGITSGIYNFMKKSSINYKKHILICAPSNCAIDEIISRILKKGLHDEDGNTFVPKIVRLGVTDKNTSEEIKKITIENLAKEEMMKINNDFDHKNLLVDLKLQIEDTQKEIINLANAGNKKDPIKLKAAIEKKEQLLSKIIEKRREKRDNKDKHDEISENVLKNAEIICCTLNSTGADKLDRYQHLIEAIIVDEASQCTEPSNIIPLRFKANKLILIGDPQQLPATTFSGDAYQTQYNRSLFERIVASGIKVEFLDTQYRMLPEIRQFPSDQFYDGKLQDSTYLKTRPLPKYLEKLDKANYKFMDIKYGKEEVFRYSYYNESEIEATIKQIDTLESVTEIEKCRIGVITPYKEQMLRMKARIGEKLGYDYEIEVNTVDAFQGREKDIIIFSCVRSRNFRNEKAGIGFLNDIRRLNVALTRAKFCMYILGNSEILSQNEVWRSFLKHFGKTENYWLCERPYEYNKLMERIKDCEIIPSSKLRLPEKNENNLKKRNKSAFETKIDSALDINNQKHRFKPKNEEAEYFSPEKEIEEGELIPEKFIEKDEEIFERITKKGEKCQKLLKTACIDKIVSSSASRNVSPTLLKDSYNIYQNYNGINMMEEDFSYNIRRRNSKGHEKTIFDRIVKVGDKKNVMESQQKVDKKIHSLNIKDNDKRNESAEKANKSLKALCAVTLESSGQKNKQTSKVSLKPVEFGKKGQASLIALAPVQKSDKSKRKEKVKMGSGFDIGTVAKHMNKWEEFQTSDKMEDLISKKYK